MIQLSEIPYRAPKNLDRAKMEAQTEKWVEKIGELQTILYGERKHSLLIVFQGMDGSGKDGVTRALFQGCSPAGVRVVAYKKPTEEEFAHDFLWRIHKHAPEKGFIQVFNRSHYEDVLIQRVHKWIDEERVTKRIAAINAFEELLQFDNNTTILKFYMHISHEKQLEKLQERIDLPQDNWKHGLDDWKETKLWEEYMKAYEYLFSRCTVPWHILPCDQKWYRNYLAVKTVYETLKNLNMQLPTLKPADIAAVDALKK
jgi:PPK2 family polyphosphate:nucleotide phosphotransferase